MCKCYTNNDNKSEKSLRLYSIIFNIICTISEILQIIMLIPQITSYNFYIPMYCILGIVVLLNIIDIWVKISILCNLISQTILLVYMVKYNFKNSWFVVNIIISLLHISYQIRSRSKVDIEPMRTSKV